MKLKSQHVCLFLFRLTHDMTQSREVLAMMDAHTTTFGRKKGCAISRCNAFLLGAFFLISLVVTGLLVYHFAPCLEEKQVQPCTDSAGDSLLSTGRSFSMTPTKKKIDVRLPKAIVPDMYELWLIPFIWEGNFTFHGEVILYSVIFIYLCIIIYFVTNENNFLFMNEFF